jgi:phosphoribosyl-AMP cyclohydrolase
MTKTFAARGTTDAIEHGTEFQPKFDAAGLIPAIVTNATSGAVLMFAHMNSEALRLTLETGYAHFWSRSRNKLWKKGDESGNVLTVQDIRTDCDQDVLLVSVAIAGAGVACHTGAVSCFYRRLDRDTGKESGVQLVNVAAVHARAKP